MLEATPAVVETAPVVKTSLVAAAAFTVKVPLVVERVGLVVLAVRDLPVPAWLTLRLANVAVPVASVFCDVVPLRVPPPFKPCPPLFR